MEAGISFTFYANKPGVEPQYQKAPALIIAGQTTEELDAYFAAAAGSRVGKLFFEQQATQALQDGGLVDGPSTPVHQGAAATPAQPAQQSAQPSGDGITAKQAKFIKDRTKGAVDTSSMTKSEASALISSLIGD